MASPTLVMDPSDVARREVESNLRVVWRGSQRVNLSVCVCMYVCMYVIVKCGWRWDNNAIPFNMYVLCVVVNIVQSNV